MTTHLLRRLYRRHVDRSCLQWVLTISGRTFPRHRSFVAGESQPTQASLGDVKWFDLFQDEQLRSLITGGAEGQFRHPHRCAAGGSRRKGNWQQTRLRLFPPVGRPGKRFSQPALTPRFSLVAGGYGIAFLGNRPSSAKLRQALQKPSRADLDINNKIPVTSRHRRTRRP